MSMEYKRRPSRKKTTRACNHCHKAHMTCDDTRPCKRCYQRGLESTCVDAPRKQKKYLMDAGEGSRSSASPPSTQPALSTTPGYGQGFGQVTLPPLPTLIDQVNQQQLLPAPTQLPIINDLYPPQLTLTKGASPQSQQQQQHYYPSLSKQQTAKQSRSKFMSNAANSEYSILSDIIKQDELAFASQQQQSQSFDSSSPQFDNGIYVHRKDSSGPSADSTPQSIQHDIYSSYGKGDKTINQYMLGFVQDKLVTFPEALKTVEGDRHLHGADSALNEPTSVLSFSIAINETIENGNGSTTTTSQSPWGLLFKESEDIYAKIRKPFSYTPGFHSLIQYLKTRFARDELIQMAKAMASYRPSFIACTNTLKEEDLIFMEQCFQRTLLEYDKFISLSGTPTIVWRRTGQISYVSEEFCILTGWSKEQLLNKVTFIVELMDDSSVLEYFNLFSTIAYGDFRGATMAGCTLMTPENSRIKTTCMWTLKRDVFGIPMMIIGNFLPIL